MSEKIKILIVEDELIIAADLQWILAAGGNDSEGYSQGGTPYCADPYVDINDLPAEWRCGNKNNKVLICHDGNTLCVNPNALADHLSHGDYIGPCDNASCTQNLIAKISTGQAEMDALHLYPNPTQKEINLEWESEIKGIADIQIVDLNGRVLFSQKILTTEGRNTFTHNIYDFENGVYFLKITTESDMQLLRFLKFD